MPSLHQLWLVAVVSLAMLCRGTDLETNVPEPGHMDNFVIVWNKILNTAKPLLSARVGSRIECAKICTELEWKCFGANLRRIDGNNGQLLCEAFLVLLSDMSRLEASDGDLYLNPGRRDYWTGFTTGLEHLSTNCLMCICWESGCEGISALVSRRTAGMCGPLTETHLFWCDGTRNTCNDDSKADYEACSKEMDCSREVFAGYVSRYESTCVGTETPTCHHYSLITSSGPYSCDNPKNEVGDKFWKRVTLCCNNHGGC